MSLLGNIKLFSAPQLRGVHERDDGGQAQRQLRDLHRGRGHWDGGGCRGGCVGKYIQQDDRLSEVSLNPIENHNICFLGA